MIVGNGVGGGVGWGQRARESIREQILVEVDILGLSVFYEAYIAGVKNLAGGTLPAPIGLASRRVSDENTFDAASIDFRVMIFDEHECAAPNFPQVTQVWLELFETFVRCLTELRSCGCSGV